MLTRKQGQIVLVFLMCITMAGAISLALNFVNLGFDKSLGYFMSKWLKAWVIGLVVSIPVALLTVPVLRKFVDSITA